MDKQSRNLTIDVIRVLALSGVILIHTANVVYARLDFFGGINWWIANILNSASRVSVPLFLLISGSLLLSKDISFTNMLKRIALRLLLPLFVWICIYALWNGKEFGFSNFSLALLTIIFTGKIFHLYFLVILLGLYFATPFLRSFITKNTYSTNLVLTRILVSLGAIYVLLQFMLNRCSLENIFSLWIPYTGLFLAGYVLREKKLVNTPIIVAGYLLGLATTVVLNYLYYSSLKNGAVMFSSTGCIAHYPDYFLSINVLLMSLCSYLLLLQIPFQNYIKPWGVKVVQRIARASFGMYLCHLLLLYVIDTRFHTFDYITPLWLAIIIRWVSIFLLSYGLTSLALKIPLIKYVFGGK